MINLTESEIGKCISFSYAVSQNTDERYKNRNKSTSTEKIIFDHFSGKAAEIAISKHFDSKGYFVSYPCFKLSNRGDSGSDLIVLNQDQSQILNIHVKCCRFDAPVKDSWIIERNELSRFKDNDYFALTKFHSPSQIEIMKIVKHSDIPWKEPRNKNLKSKAACYLSDLT